MMGEPDDLDAFIRELPAVFKELQAFLKDPECSRWVHNVATRWRTFGAGAVFGGETNVFGVRLAVFGPRYYETDKLEKLAQAAALDPQADTLFREIVGEFILRGKPLPPSVRLAASKRTSATYSRPESKRSKKPLPIATRARPKLKPGRKPEDNFLRDCLIRMAVAALVELGLRPTRNREQRDRPSACSIVRDALAQAGVHLTEAAVEKIWKPPGRTRVVLPKPVRRINSK
jgi:hypothetical protein